MVISGAGRTASHQTELTFFRDAMRQNSTEQAELTCGEAGENQGWAAEKLGKSGESCQDGDNVRRASRCSGDIAASVGTSARKWPGPLTMFWKRADEGSLACCFIKLRGPVLGSSDPGL